VSDSDYTRTVGYTKWYR